MLIRNLTVGFILVLLVGSVRAEEVVEAPALPDSLRDSYVRVVRNGGFSPFKRIEFSVIARHTAPVVNYRKSLVNYSERLSSMSLVSLSDYAQFLRVVQAEDVLKLLSPSPTVPQEYLPVYHVEVRVGGVENAFSFQSDHSLELAHHQAVVDATIKFVQDRTRRLPFRNVFFEGGRMGYVDIESVPTARVFIDEQDTGLMTPLENYELEKGNHRLRLVSDREKIDRTYDFRIEAGMTTLMRLDLH